MSLFEAILMGLIQGLTEFLPVSSSGHLAIFKNLFNINTDTGIMFDVLLHLGTLIAIFAVYYKDIWEMIVEVLYIIRDFFLNVFIFIGNFFRKDKKDYMKLIDNSFRKFAMLVIVSTIPTGIIGVLADDYVKKAATILIVPGICLIVTGILLCISDHLPSGDKTPKKASFGNALFIGVCQGIATLPGLSRSGTTITACLFSGYNRKFAVKYSFIMSIPAVLGAAILELKDFNLSTTSSTDMISYIVGMVVAAVVGYICIKTMLLVVRKKKFTYFAIYCFLIGALSIGGFFYLA